ISNIGPLTATTGDVAITDTSALGIVGLVKATSGNVYLETSNSGGITFGAFGVQSKSGGIVGLQANKVINLGTSGATGTINTGAGGTFELAPDTQGNALTLGTGVALNSLTGITADAVRLGAVTIPGTGLKTIAGSIAVAGTGFDATGAKTLELDATTTGGGSGDVGQSQALLNVGTLIGTAASYTLTNASNTIGTIAALTASTGNLSVKDASALTIAATVQATSGNVYLQSSKAAGITFGAAGVARSVA